MGNYGKCIQAIDGYILVIRHMRFACWINKTTDNHSEYVIVKDFSRQQCYREGAPVLLRKFIARLVLFVCCVRSGLCDEFSTRSEESNRVSVCLIVCDL